MLRRWNKTLVNQSQDAVGKAVVDSIAAQAKTSRTWVFETDEDGYAEYSEDFKISGDNLYYYLGESTLPLGAVVIHEKQAPTGYLNNNVDKYWVRTITSNNSGLPKVETYNAPNGDTAIKEQVKRGDLSFTKKFSNIGNRGKNIPFLLTSKSTGEKHV